MKEEILRLAKKFNLTDIESEPEEYILTPDEEKKVLEHELISLKKYEAWKLLTNGFKQESIDLKLAQVDWENVLDKSAILTRANSLKLHEEWHKSQRLLDRLEAVKKQERALEAARLLQERCNAKYMFNVMSWTSLHIFKRKLIIHNDNRHLITTLCYFLSKDPRFETELGYSFKKGLLIRGISGLGKTYLVKCLEHNELAPILPLSTLKVTKAVQFEGEYKVEMNGNKILYLDDVGTEEPTVTHFGTQVSWFKEFIELYYLEHRDYSSLILSTNNSFKEIEYKYGFRVRSRMKGDMFNTIDVTGQDMRGS